MGRLAGVEQVQMSEHLGGRRVLVQHELPLAAGPRRNHRTLSSEMSASVASGQAEASNGRVRSSPVRSKCSTRLAYSAAVSSGMLSNRRRMSWLAGLADQCLHLGMPPGSSRL